MEQVEKPVLKAAIKHYGHASQVLKTFEECGELLNALAKYYTDPPRSTKEDVIEELADVSIMIDQMALEFGLSEFLAERAYKIKRLKERIQKSDNGNKDN